MPKTAFKKARAYGYCCSIGESRIMSTAVPRKTACDLASRCDQRNVSKMGVLGRRRKRAVSASIAGGSLGVGGRKDLIQLLYTAFLIPAGRAGSRSGDLKMVLQLSTWCSTRSIYHRKGDAICVCKIRTSSNLKMTCTTSPSPPKHRCLQTPPGCSAPVFVANEGKPQGS